MMETACLISLGSNTDGDRNLEIARKELLRYFPDITYAKECRTRPINLHNPSLFVNQVALFHTLFSLYEVKNVLKDIEYVCAEIPKDKVHEIIRMDIDLLQFGKEVLKPEDMKRPYIRNGVKLLSI